jgi:hypothetical protein
LFVKQFVSFVRDGEKPIWFSHPNPEEALMQKRLTTFVVPVLAVFAALVGNVHAQPLILKQTFLNPTPALNEFFGQSVAGFGNNVVIGAPGTSDGGAAYLLDSATGSVILNFVNPTPEAGDNFGYAVATFGNNVLISAPFDNTAGTQAGAAYLFDGTTGALLQTFLNPTPAPPFPDQFGLSVSGIGNTAIIGAPNDDAGATDSGVAYVFDSLTGSLLQTLLNPAPASGDQFGAAVAVVGSNVLVGTPLDGTTDIGVAYLFASASGSLLLTIANPAPENMDRFGNAVAAAGNDLVVAARLDNPGGINDAGSVYLFSGTTGTLLQTFTNPAAAPNDRFGVSVSASGTTIVVLVGAGEDDAGASNAGSAYLFDGTTGALVQSFTNPTPESGDQFGVSVASFGDNVLVGAPFDNSGGFNNSGAAYLYGPANQPPLANAGADQTVECTSPTGAQVTLDGSASSDPDLDALTYTWRENGNVIAGPTSSPTSQATFALGSHTVELTVDDGKGETDTDEVSITVVDTAPPSITLNGDNPMTLECHVDSYTELSATVSDACDPSPTFAMSGTVDVNVVGAYTITYSASDASGNSSSTTRTVNVVDTTPPVITLKQSITLWPPNHKYTKIDLDEMVASVSDGCAGSIAISEVLITSASSDEPEDAPGGYCCNFFFNHICWNGDGSTDDDIVIDDDCQYVKLRAERNAWGNGRVYTVNLQVSDPSGNVATAAFKVTVPKNSYGCGAPVDDGPVYTVNSNCAGSSSPSVTSNDVEDEPSTQEETAGTQTSIMPDGFALLQNYPNPFNPETQIRFELPDARHVVIKIFNSLGSEVRTLADGEYAAGRHELRWDGQNAQGEKVPSGVYFYQMRSSNFKETKSMLLAK